MILLFLLYFLVAISFVVAKIALQFSPPIFLIGFRMTLSGILMLAYLFLFKKDKLKIKLSDLNLFFKTSLFHIYLAFLLEFWALQYLSSLETNLIYSTTPFITLLLSRVLLKSQISTKKIIGAIMGFMGLLPIFFSQTNLYLNSTFAVLVPEIVMLFAVFSSAYAWFLVKELMNNGYDLILINGISMLLSGIGALITSYFLEKEQLVMANWQLFYWVIALIFISNICMYNLYAWLLRTYPLTLISFLGFLSPIFGAFIGRVVLFEKISWHYFFSFIIMLLSLYIFYRDELKFKDDTFWKIREKIKKLFAFSKG